MSSVKTLMARPWVILLLPFLLLVMPLDVMAQKMIAAPGMTGSSAWTVYAFGNAQAVSDAFRAIANFTASSVFQSIVGMIAVIGVIMVGISSGFSAAIAKKFISYAVFVFFICYLFFGIGTGGPLTVNVEVIDSVDNTWVAPVTVPAVVGIPAALISGAGQALTRQIEASFPLPDEMKLSNGAPFNLAASLLADAQNAKISDPNVASSLAYYVQDCFVIAVARGELSAVTLINSTDFLKEIRTDMKSVYVNTSLGDPVGYPTLVSCVDAYNLINEAISANGGNAASFFTKASSWAKTPALSVVNSAVDAVAQWATSGAVTNGGDIVKQAAVLSAFTPAFRQAATATGNSDFLTGLAVTQATESQKNGWIVGAEIFNRIMGYIFAILQVFVYAITPLILAVSLIPSLGLALLKNFCQILIWLAIWQPMLAIVNFIVVSLQHADLGGALSAGGSFGITMANTTIISERTANMSAAASFVGTMVPALAWAFVKGSIDFSRVIGAAVGENFAQQAGNTLTTGNYSLNQGSMDSFTANKTSISSMHDFGNGYSVNGTQRMGVKHDHGAGTITEGDTAIALGSSTGRSISDQQARSRSAGTGVANSQGSSYTAAGSQGQTGSVTESGGETNNSATITQAGAGVSFNPRSSGGGRPSTVPGGPSEVTTNPDAGLQPRSGAATRDVAGNVLGSVLDKFSAKVDASASAQSTKLFTAGETTSKGRQYGDTQTRSDMQSSTASQNKAENANATESTAQNRNITLTGPANSYDRAQVLNEASRPLSDNANFLGRAAGTIPNRVEGDTLADIYSGRTQENDYARMYQQTVEPGRFNNDFNAEKGSHENDLRKFQGEVAASSGVPGLPGKRAQLETEVDEKIATAKKEGGTGAVLRAVEAGKGLVDMKSNYDSQQIEKSGASPEEKKMMTEELKASTAKAMGELEPKPALTRGADEQREPTGGQRAQAASLIPLAGVVPAPAPQPPTTAPAVPAHAPPPEQPAVGQPPIQPTLADHLRRPDDHQATAQEVSMVTAERDRYAQAMQATSQHLMSVDRDSRDYTVYHDALDFGVNKLRT